MKVLREVECFANRVWFSKAIVGAHCISSLLKNGAMRESSKRQVENFEITDRLGERKASAAKLEGA